ncbi:MAG: hypothetical protein HKO57_01680 [Akkermansiaceae bacterium]|nr:hypothetical protein [Akkermansiaceae bacterium]
MNLPPLVAAVVLAPGLLVAQDGAPEEPRRKRAKLSPALDLLPEGSTLKKVRIPRFDEEKRPSALLRAGLLRVVTEDEVIGENIDLFIFTPAGAERLRVHMGTAAYTVSRGILEAHHELTLEGEGFSASGAGAVFQLDSRRGFLHGPVTNTFAVDPRKTTSAMTPEPLHTVFALASLLVAAPEPLTPAQLQDQRDMARSAAPRVDAESAPTREMITRNDQLSKAASLGFQTFASEIRRPRLLTLAAAGAVVAETPKPNPGGIRITCDGGMYFDAEKGHVVYLKNIVVTDPTFTFECQKELKIILERKAVEKKEPAGAKGKDGENANAGEKKKGLVGPESFGDVQNIIATGGVRVVRRDPKGRDIIASADTASYDARSGDVVLRGGFPTVIQGKNFLRAREPGLYIRLYDDGNVYCEPGKWETDVASIEDLKKKK